MKIQAVLIDGFKNLSDVKITFESLSELSPILMNANLYHLLSIDVNSVDMREFERLVNESRAEGGTLALDATAIIQNKIDKGILDSNSKIDKFEKILGRSFNK